MKRYISFTNFMYFMILSFLFNSFLLVKDIPSLLILFIPILILLNIIPGLRPKGTKKFRLKLCNHGTTVLTIFIFSLVPSIVWHSILAFRLLPDLYIDFLFSALYCFLLSAIFFWNGIICVYCTSTQLGIKWRVKGILCGMIPVLNLIMLTKIIKITSSEVEFEIEKEIITSNPSLADICKTKYPIVLIHGIFFRDFTLFNYWGRIPQTLKIHGATVFYGKHQLN